jgi:hypothetical protein
MTYPEKRNMPNADISLCRVVSLSMLSGFTAVYRRIIRDIIIRDIIIERRPTTRIIHILKPRRIPNDRSKNPTTAIDMNTDIVDRMTSFMISGEYCFDFLTW